MAIVGNPAVETQPWFERAPERKTTRLSAQDMHAQRLWENKAVLPGAPWDRITMSLGLTRTNLARANNLMTTSTRPSPCRLSPSRKDVTNVSNSELDDDGEHHGL